MSDTSSSPRAIDPGAEPSLQTPKSPDRVEWLLGFLTRHPNATLSQGEGRLLADEIVRLRALLP